LNAGDTMTVLTPGGGGYGDPHLRDPALVARDVARGFVSAEAARRDYGVALDGARVDDAATQRLRGNRPAQAQRPIDGGPARAAWETVFTDARMSEFAHRLLKLPRIARGEQRKRIVAEVAPALGRTGDIAPAIVNAVDQGTKFDRAIAELPLDRAAE
jgi:N-methylhydantoinase B